MKPIAITGGIGSGKSVVSRMLIAMGYMVYDCDSRAAAIMATDKAMQQRIANEISSESVAEGCINRKKLAEVVFADKKALERLNSIVHGAVREDIRNWIAHNPDEILFVETAILYQSGIDKMVSQVWMVDAPTWLREERAMARDNASWETIAARIAAQDSFVPEVIHPATIKLVNDGVEPLIPQLLAALAAL